MPFRVTMHDKHGAGGEATLADCSREIQNLAYNVGRSERAASSGKQAWASPWGSCMCIRMSAMAASPCVACIICVTAVRPHRASTGRTLTAFPCKSQHRAHIGELK